MTNPKRYDPVIYGDEAVVDDGPYVKWEDYERLQRENEQLRRSRESLYDQLPVKG